VDDFCGVQKFYPLDELVEDETVVGIFEDLLAE
jgi:hypothetical protein